MKMESEAMINAEILKQNKKYSLQHDITEHGHKGLVEIATLLISGEPLDEDVYESWMVKLKEKHQHNPAERYAIAAAMLLRAIDCYFYELGIDLNKHSVTNNPVKGNSR
jgi:hypothetical protein